MAMSKGRIILIAAGVVALAAGATGFAVNRRFKRSEPVVYADPIERFKYGSIGTEGFFLPIRIFDVLPDICPDKFPGGYAALGWLYEPGKPLPIGLSQRDMGVMRFGFNCAACHSGSYRESKDSKTEHVLGAPPIKLDLEKFLRLSIDCVLDPRFTVDTTMTKMEAHEPLSFTDSLVFRYLVLPKVMENTVATKELLNFFDRRPDYGPGRFDALNFIRLDLGFHPDKDGLIGTTDYPSIWDQESRKTHFAQWDAATNSIPERNRLAAIIAAGNDLEAIDEDELRWLDKWLLTMPVPAYPFTVDEALAKKGQPLFEQHCANCHAPEGKRTGLPTPLAEIGTDPNRTNSLTPEVGAAINTMHATRWSIKSFRKTGGYANVLLDAVWMRAPYLHNGSVPTLRELLNAPEKRAKVYYRGYDVFDQKNYGFVASGPDAEKAGWKYDTSVAGNSNAGHNYASDLSDDEKDALIEYVKLRDKHPAR